MVRNLYKPKLWTKQEDDVLKKIVQKLGSKKWKASSQAFNSTLNLARTSKQCRDRWSNYLKGCKTSSFTDNEVTTMVKYYDIYGTKWAKISRHLKGRTENQVKNFFYSTIRRNIRRFNKHKKESEQICLVSIDLLKNLEIRHILLARKETSRKSLMKKKFSQEAKEFIEKCCKKKELNEQESISGDIENDYIYNTSPLLYMDESMSNQDTYFIKECESVGQVFPEYTLALEFEYYK
ncbi:hypothetical protein SteCoe_1371 [Stentor coeruleus]|uniref:Myb-like DNA-binding domain containing protein n=1 Tax=Stentor coeruleus TaxID=5963 RepID=A0A1R2D241_9CILI|nr:hypothetical protein SteCoe_1371 [Stentor coeruleus]